MREAFRLPDVGEGISEAEIVEYLVHVGDSVDADQNVVRVETDKAVVELPTPFGGTVAEIPHEPGDTVEVGDALLIIETDREAPAEKPEEAKEEEAAAEEKPKKKEKPEKEKKPEPEERAEPEKEEKPEPAKRVLATPHTRKVAREMGVDLTTVKGTGKGGRITDEDVEKAAEKAKAEKKPEAPKAPSAAAVRPVSTEGFDFEQYGPTHREPLKGVRKRTAEVMVRSVSVIPHVTHFDEADVTDLMQVVEQKRAFADDRGVHLTILAFIAKACADALRKYPRFNSSLDEEAGEIVYKDYVHMGFATDTEAGLMVPVVREVDRKSVLQIAGDLQELAEKARERSIDIEDLRGGTFTITNVGAIGGVWATPIIVHPQVAILCTLRAKKKPVVRNDEVVARTMMPLTLSFDHRVLDGADSARFITHVRELLEDPMRMLVDVA